MMARSSGLGVLIRSGGRRQRNRQPGRHRSESGGGRGDGSHTTPRHPTIWEPSLQGTIGVEYRGVTKYQWHRQQTVTGVISERENGANGCGPPTSAAADTNTQQKASPRP